MAMTMNGKYRLMIIIMVIMHQAWLTGSRQQLLSLASQQASAN
jgi:hypothetical protein